MPVQLLCSTEGTTLYRRFLERSQLSERHVGHCDFESKEEFKEQLLKGRIEEMKLQVPLYEIDTTDWRNIDFEKVLADVRAYID